MAEYRVFVKKFATSLSIAILAIPFTLLFACFVVLIALPLKLYTKFINILAHLLDSDIEKMITGLGAGQGRDYDELSRKPCTTEVTCIRFKGTLNFPELKSEFERRIVMKLDETKDYPTLHYPELQQYFTVFLGYLFLKKDHKFDINNHVTFYNKDYADKPVTRTDLIRIWEYQMVKPFVKNRSPWELVIIDNYVPDRNELEVWRRTYPNIWQENDRYWIVMFRMHHAMADGFSVQHLLTFMTDNPYQTSFPYKITPYQKFMLNARALTLGPYDLLKFLIYKAEGFHALHRPYSEHSKDYFIAESDLCSVERVKRIREKFGVSFTVILVSLISGGIRKYLQKYGKKIPTSGMSAAIPFATEDHTDKFTNEFSLTTVKYAVHLDDPKDRVEHAKQEFKSLLTTSTMRMTDFIIDIYGCVPIRLFRAMSENQIYCSTYSTMPGPKEPTTTFGSNMLEVNYSYGTCPDSASFGISSITYSGNFRFILFIDTHVVGSRVAAEDIVRFISEEFAVLENYDLNQAEPQKMHSDYESEKQSALEKAEVLRMTRWKKSIEYD